MLLLLIFTDSLSFNSVDPGPWTQLVVTVVSTKAAACFLLLLFSHFFCYHQSFRKFLRFVRGGSIRPTTEISSGENISPETNVYRYPKG